MINPVIEFDAEHHTYKVDGITRPGVTSVLAAAGLSPDFSCIPPNVLEAKRKLGEDVHYYTMLCDSGFDVTDMHELQPYIDGWKMFVKETGFKSLAREKILYSPQHQYCGTVDAVGEAYGQVALIDIKCSAVVDLTNTGPQTAAYEQAWAELKGEKINKRYVVKLMPNAYKLIPCKDKNDLQIFLYALQIYNWRMRNNGKH